MEQREKHMQWPSGNRKHINYEERRFLFGEGLEWGMGMMRVDPNKSRDPLVMNASYSVPPTDQGLYIHYLKTLK